MKYIDAEKLIAEIEKHIKEVKDAAKRFTPNMGFFDAKLSGIYDILSIIDSLQQEQPEIFDSVAFQKGVQEGRRLERDEPVTDCHDLKEEIERTYHDGSVADTDDMDHVDYENIARHFAEWQKRKMMDDAVEAKVKADLDPHGADYGIRYLYVRMPDNSPIGDKVRIIIVKEEE